MTDVLDLTATTSLSNTDILYTVVDPSGTPLDRKATVQTMGVATNKVRIPFLTNTVKTITNTTSETTMLDTASTGSYTFAANTFAALYTLRVSAKGTLNTIGSPGNITIKGKFGSTLIVTSGAVALAANQSSVNYNLELDISCVTAGVSGTFRVEGYLLYGDGNGTRINLTNAGNTVTVDTTISEAFNLTAQFSVADPSNTLNTVIVIGERMY